MKKFLAIVLAFTILSLPMVAQCSASEGYSDQSILVEYEEEIKDMFYELTRMKIKDGEPLYRASRDCFSNEKFHEKCDGHENTVVIVKVKDGDIVGGYTSAAWASEGDETYDDKAFLFSLTKNKIYPIKADKKNEAIYCSESFGACFNYGLEIEEKKGSSDIGRKNKIFNSNYEANGDNPGTFVGYPSSKYDVRFEIDDYEVYELSDESIEILQKEREEAERLPKEKIYELTGIKVKKLLYRASRDGFSNEKFHEKCDGHSNTVVIVKVKGGDIVGGYTSAAWASDDEFARDNKAFLFSLTKNKIYPIKADKKNKAIYCFNRRGAYFKDGLTIDGKKGSSYIGRETYNSNYEANGDTPWSFIGYEKSDGDDITGCKNFKIEDYEVYEVE